MDISGVESSMAVLKDMSRTQKKNIFLISHKDELVSRVNSVLKVVKENGFTNYANDVDIIPYFVQSASNILLGAAQIDFG